MSKKKKNKNRTNNEDEYKNKSECEKEIEEIEDFIENLDIYLANLEKVGVIFLIVGYSNFFHGADLDILESLEINTSGQSPDSITFFGQKLVLTGYLILWIVSIKRLHEENFRNTNNEEEINLSPYMKVANSYLLSAISNSMRLEGFAEIDSLNGNSEFIE